MSTSQRKLVRACHERINVVTTADEYHSIECLLTGTTLKGLCGLIYLMVLTTLAMWTLRHRTVLGHTASGGLRQDLHPSLWAQEPAVVATNRVPTLSIKVNCLEGRDHVSPITVLGLAQAALGVKHKPPNSLADWVGLDWQGVRRGECAFWSC